MNQNEKLLRMILNDPALLKTIEKMTSSASAEKAKEKKEKPLHSIGSPSYVNEVSVTCKLCGMTQKRFIMMAYDSTEKLYRSSCHSTANLWPSLPLYTLKQRTPTCPHCPNYLASQDQASLISRVINLSNSAHERNFVR